MVLHNSISQIVNDVLTNSNITDWLYGTIIKTEPLTVQISQKQTLTEGFLEVLPELKEHKINVSYEEEGETIEKEITIKNDLLVGDKLILLKQSGGQKYLVLAKTKKTEATNINA